MAFMNLEVEFFQLNLLHLRPGCHYTPVGCHGMPKISHGGFAYTFLRHPVDGSSDVISVVKVRKIRAEGNLLVTGKVCLMEVHTKDYGYGLGI